MGKFDSYTENTNPPGTATILADTGVNTERVPIGVLTSWKKPARIATEVNDTLSGLAARDGITPIAGDRVLVKAQSTASANGIYVAAAGSWIRSTDFDTDAKAIANILVPVEEGTVNADKVFQLTTNNPITIGTTSLTFIEFGSEESAFVFVVGNGVDVITTGIKVVLRVEFDCEITRWTMIAKESGSIVIDVNRYTSLANYDAGTKASITGTDKPDLVSDKSDDSVALTGWTVILNAGDILEAEVDSITTITRNTLSLRVTKRG